MPNIVNLGYLGSRGFTLAGDGINDFMGRGVSSAGDINNDGYDDLMVSGRNGLVGEAYIIFGRAGGFTTLDPDLAPSEGFVFRGSVYQDGTEYSVSSAGDVNADGFADMIVGLPRGDRGGGDAGEAYVIFGKAGGFTSITAGGFSAADGFFIQGTSLGGSTQLGLSVSSAGDVNADGYDDIIVGAAGENGSRGAAYVIFGKAGGFANIDVTALAAADGFAIRGANPNENVGRSVSSAGDVNNDGYDDLLVGVPFSNVGGTRTGQAYVIFGKAAGFGTINLASLAPGDGFVLQGADADERTGLMVSEAGDVNNDGFGDILVTGRTTAYLIYGKAAGFGTVDLGALTPAEGIVFVGGIASVSSAGDVNGDGVDDFLLGAPTAGGAPHSNGEVYLVFGKAGGLGPIDLRNMAAADGFMLMADKFDWGAQAGFSVAGAGDINGDGFDDLAIGAPQLDTNRGEAYFIFGSADFPPAIGSPNDDILYGTWGEDDLRGAGGNDLLDGREGVDATTGGAGDDTHYVDHVQDLAFEALGDGVDRVITSVSYVLGAGQEIETLTTYGSSTLTPLALTGNEFANTLVGNDAANVLDGKGGADTMHGYDGNDTYYVDNIGDVVIDEAGASDTIIASASFAMGVDSEIELLRTSNPAGTQAINLTGSSTNNILQGNAGANALDGREGADTMQGFGGNDVYYVDHANDSVIEAGGGGSDRVITSASYVLRAGQEIEQLTTYGSATTAAINLTGNELANTVVGNNGANSIDGKGGADLMWGYAGNDTYYVDQSGDRIGGEAAGGGSDLVITNVSYTLAAGQQIERLTTYGSSIALGLNLTGNEFANTIVGDNGANVLDGKGGADLLWGYAGNDTYYVDNSGDRIGGEGGGGGSDWVIANASFALGAGQQVELLTTYGSATTEAINLAGNEFANTIVGNAAANSIDGKGGIDSMYGYAGNDTYFVDNAADGVTEAAGGGSDWVITNVSYTLAAGQEIETLTTYGSAVALGVDLTGNAIVNTIVGDDGDNSIDGKGGSDLLYGYAGLDLFAFTTALGAGNVDRIGDFQGGLDKVLLENAIFTGLAQGSLPASAFVTGPAAQDADDRIVYNSATGALLFDADGVGGAAAVQFATLNPALALTANDFVVI